MLSEVANKVQKILERLRGNIQADMVRRKLNATGRTAASIRTNTLSSLNFVSGSLYADEAWEFVGNGRKAGKQPPIEPLKQWIESRGLDMSPYALAKSRAKKGTKRREENVFLANIEKMEKAGEFNVLQEFAAAARKELIPSFRKLGRA